MSRLSLHSLALVVVVSLMMIFGCASSGGGNSLRAQREQALAEFRPGTIPVRVENNVWNTVTVYVTNGGSRLRIGECSGASQCWFWVNQTTATRIFSEGTISLGWRFFGGPAGLHGQGTVAAWDGLTFVLTLNKANWFMRSEFFRTRET